MPNIQLPSIDDYDDIDTKNYYKTMVEEGASPKEALAESQAVSRDNARTPMQWDDSENGGFSPSRPWLPVNENYVRINARQQMADENSVFKFYQKLIALRKENPVLVHGDFELCCPEEGPVIAYTRSFDGVTWLAAHNFSGGTQRLACGRVNREAQVILGNYKEQAIEEGILELRAYETVILKVE